MIPLLFLSSHFLFLNCLIFWSEFTVKEGKDFLKKFFVSRYRLFTMVTISFTVSKELPTLQKCYKGRIFKKCRGFLVQKAKFGVTLNLSTSSNKNNGFHYKKKHIFFFDFRYFYSQNVAINS